MFVCVYVYVWCVYVYVWCVYVCECVYIYGSEAEKQKGVRS
jgi:hypothetical protein